MEIPTDRDCTHTVCVGQHLRGSFSTPVRRHIIAPVSRTPSRTYNPTHGLRRPAGTWKKPSRPQTRAMHFFPIHPSILRIPTLPSIHPSHPPPPPPQSPQQTRPHDHPPPTPPTGREKKCPPQNLTSLAGQPHRPKKPSIPKIRTNAQPAPSASVPQSHNAQLAGTRSRRSFIIIPSAKTLSPEKASVVRWWGAGWRAEEGKGRERADCDRVVQDPECSFGV